jgi:DNA-binding NarL/FixJ family response regulator/class 3 adenylate cyclase
MADLPGGTVSYLFTDIEGSTRLLKELRGGYGDVLADHQRLLRATFAEVGGREIDTQGDAFFVAFRRARDAVAAAVAAQRALAAHAWPGRGEVRVRMGIHTDEPVVAEGRYVGLGVHRAARICAAGHGGQVLLSYATRELVEPELPADVGLGDHGEHRLKDLDRPEHLFQLVIEGLPAEFPPLRAERAAARPTGPLRVILADDATLIREGLARLLAEEGFHVVAQASDAGELLARVESDRPDLAIVDIRMPPTFTDEGLVAAQQIRAAHPDVGVLVLSQYVDVAYAMKLLTEAAERVGYLLKDRIVDAPELAAALRRIAAGGSVVDPALVAELVSAPAAKDPLSELTSREREVLALLAEGRTDRGIAKLLYVTPKTVEAHVRSIFRKLDLPSDATENRRVHAVLAFLRAQTVSR